MPTLDPRLLELLRCPATQQRLVLAETNGEPAWLLREDGRVRYPVRNGIPILLPAEAQPAALEKSE